MDLATMVVVLLFRGGDSGHFIQGAPNMSACLRTVASERRAEPTPGSAEDGLCDLSRLPTGFAQTVRWDPFAQRQTSKLSLRSWEAKSLDGVSVRNALFAMDREDPCPALQEHCVAVRKSEEPGTNCVLPDFFLRRRRQGNGAHDRAPQEHQENAHARDNC